MTHDRPVALVVDDEPHILSFLSENLSADGYEVHAAASIAAARSKLNAYLPDIALVDIGLPDGSGLDLCREIRESEPLDVRWSPEMAVIMLTARGDEVDRVRGFQRGADDFLPKPFHYPELVARMSAVLRRTRQSQDPEILRAAGISLDLGTREVQVGGLPVDLSTKEFMLLAALAREPRRVFRKQHLLELVWGFRAGGKTRTLDSHASRLRVKLRTAAPDRPYIANVWGIGYRLLDVEEVE